MPANVPAVVEQARADAASALEAGDKRAANEAYARELQALEGAEGRGESVPAPRMRDPSGHGEPSTEVVDAAFQAMAFWDDDLDRTRADDLRAKWGASAAANLAFAQSFAEANPDVRDVLNRHGLGDHPTIIEAAAILGRRYADRSGDPGSIRTTPERQTMVEDMDEGTEAELESLRAQQNQALARGNHKKANRLYQKEQALLSRRFGNAPAVGHGGRTA